MNFINFSNLSTYILNIVVTFLNFIVKLFYFIGYYTIIVIKFSIKYLLSAQTEFFKFLSKTIKTILRSVQKINTKITKSILKTFELIKQNINNFKTKLSKTMQNSIYTLSYLTKFAIKFFRLPKLLTIKLKQTKPKQKTTAKTTTLEKPTVSKQLAKPSIKNQLLAFVFGILFASAIFVSYRAYVFFNNLPKPDSLTTKHIPLSTHIYDRNGRLLYEVYRDENRTAVKLQDLPEYVKQATIAIEDKDFYKHNGVSPIGGILRATKEILLKQELQGGSTITQQLIKTSLLTPERTIERKIKEIILALWAERIYSKDEILQMYLNQIPYGGSAYGIEEASQLYFEKSAKDLSLEEAALLAGLPKAPSLYSPYNDIKLAKARRDTVLKAMYEQGYINKDRYEESIKTEVKVKPAKIKIKAPHFVFYVRQKLEEMYGRDMVEEGGLRVYTSLDLQIQEEAERIVKEEIEKVKDLNVSNGAVLVTRPSTGEILAMVGSVDFFATPSGSYNVTTALRQPGSSIKPILYSLALQKGFTSATIIHDSPVSYRLPNGRIYQPENYDGRFHGPVPLRYALANSYNIPAVKTLNKIGVTEFINYAQKLGISTWDNPSRFGLSIALGAGEVKMIDMAKAYGVLANKGFLTDLNPFIRITDKNGIEIFKPINGKKQVIPESVSFIISDILSDNQARTPAFGPNSLLNIPGFKTAVKTGTTNNLRDNWAIGYTPEYLTAVWVGNNDNSPMKNIASGITGATPIWNRTMSYILQNFQLFDIWYKIPDDIVSKPCSYKSVEYFIKGTETINCFYKPRTTPTPEISPN
ncbi:MAG: hypothetical protein KatS3mg090_0878 [Patescibacteria group bacterium]|nr:MAG: hypothetical protein KatS3mg090_0878 [Patescibacteria group bacterium]